MRPVRRQRRERLEHRSGRNARSVRSVRTRRPSRPRRPFSVQRRRPSWVRLARCRNSRTVNTERVATSAISTSLAGAPGPKATSRRSFAKPTTRAVPRSTVLRVTHRVKSVRAAMPACAYAVSAASGRRPMSRWRIGSASHRLRDARSTDRMPAQRAISATRAMRAFVDTLGAAAAPASTSRALTACGSAKKPNRARDVRRALARRARLCSVSLPLEITSAPALICRVSPPRRAYAPRSK